MERQAANWPAQQARPRRVLVAGIGNVLRGDDGFGPAVIRALAATGQLPAAVQLVELGIGGVGLVQELMDGYDMLILVDAIDRGSEPGSLYVLEPEVPEIAAISAGRRYALGADMHQTGPDSALVLARAVNALPPLVRIIGCQPAETETLSMVLSPVMERAVGSAVQIILALVVSGEGLAAP